MPSLTDNEICIGFALFTLLLLVVYFVVDVYVRPLYSAINALNSYRVTYSTAEPEGLDAHVKVSIAKRTAMRNTR